MSITKLSGMLLYVAVQTPVACFDKEKGTEFKASIVVDEDTADAFSDVYPKQSAKKVKRVDFENQFKIAPPEGDEKNLYVITLKKNSHFVNKKGEREEIADIYRPRVFEQEGNVRTEITMSKLVGNGSMGSISFSEHTNEWGTNANLKNVLVTDLIEYIRPEGDTGPAGSEFDDDDAPAAPAKQSKPAAPKAAPKAPRAKPADAPAESGGPF